jgi:hypothetical protein
VFCGQHEDRAVDIHRKDFCVGLAGSMVTIWLQGCGGGSDYGSNPPPATGSSCGASGSDISANHGHSLTIAKADLDSPTDKSYALSASVDGHVHGVTFTVGQLATLKSGGSVTVTSTTTAASASYGGTHSHSVTATVLIASCA